MFLDFLSERYLKKKLESQGNFERTQQRDNNEESEAERGGEEGGGERRARRARSSFCSIKNLTT